MTTNQNIYINFFACFGPQWNTDFALIKIFSKKDVYNARNKRP